MDTAYRRYETSHFDIQLDLSHLSEMLIAPAHRQHHTARYRACMVLIAPVGASHASGMASNHTPDFSKKNGSILHKTDSFNYTRYFE